MSNHRRKKISPPLFLFAILLLLWPISSVCAGQKNAGVQNTVILWTDSARLKAITLVSVTPGQKPIGIVAIPIITKIEENHPATLEELYNLQGRQGLIAYLQKSFRAPIKTYFCIDQKALVRASELVGPITMFGKKTTLLDVFEGSYAEQRCDLQVEIRALAQKMLEPEILVKIPALIWLLTANVETNLGPAHLLAFYQTLRGEGPNILRKEALPGRDYQIRGAKYREVAPEAWVQVFQSVTGGIKNPG